MHAQFSDVPLWNPPWFRRMMGFTGACDREETYTALHHVVVGFIRESGQGLGEEVTDSRYEHPLLKFSSLSPPI